MLHSFAGGVQPKEQRLFDAAKANDAAKVRQLLALNADPNRHRERGATALHVACQHKLSSRDTVTLLLAAHADPHAACGDEWRPLHWAAYSDAEAAVALLLEHGADPNVRNCREETPLHWAARNNSARAARVLTAHSQARPRVWQRCAGSLQGGRGGLVRLVPTH